MSVVRSELRQERGEVLLAADPLAAALEEIAKVEEALRAAGDAATLDRFGDEESGEALGAMLGHPGLAAYQARVVDRLSWLPNGLNLARAYLAAVRSGD
jgi:hypothetical protein